MSLSSVLNTAHTAISSAGFAIGVVANNMANVQTDGFKASRTVLTSGPSLTYSSGSAPNGFTGGSNPTQIGTGVQIAGVEVDFDQGSIALSSDPFDMAIEGDGFFTLEGPGGERLYSRNGDFQLNADGEFVSATGYRLMGHPVDSNFQIDLTRISPLMVPQDGGSAGTELNRVSIDQDGVIHGYFADGETRDLGQVVITQFTNPSGLVATGNNAYAQGPNSGLPMDAGTSSSVVAGALELSNASIDEGLIDLTNYSIMFRVNMQVIETATGMLDELLNLRRW